MNNSGEVQTTTDAQLNLAGPVLQPQQNSEKLVDPLFELLGLIPFDPEVWDTWSD